MHRFSDNNVLFTGAFSAITVPPSNALLVRCIDTNVTLNCAGDGNGPNTISWTYDGNPIVSPVCLNNTAVFLPAPTTNQNECSIVAMLDEARNDERIRSVSGPYGCTDQTSGGTTYVALVLALGT